MEVLSLRQLRPLLGVFDLPAEGRDRVAQLVAALPVPGGARFFPLFNQSEDLRGSRGRFRLKREDAIELLPFGQQLRGLPGAQRSFIKRAVAFADELEEMAECAGDVEV